MSRIVSTDFEQEANDWSTIASDIFLWINSIHTTDPAMDKKRREALLSAYDYSCAKAKVNRQHLVDEKIVVFQKRTRRYL